MSNIDWKRLALTIIGFASPLAIIAYLIATHGP